MPRPLSGSRLEFVRAALSAVLALACTDGAVVASRAEAGPPKDSGRRHIVDPDVVLPPCEPTFESIQRNVFAIACGVDACHGLAIAAWGLTLTDGPRARERLVGKVALGCGEFYLVTPGSPQESFLWMKVSMAKPPCGEPMPKGGPPLPEWSKVCIRDWIAGLGNGGDAQVDAR